jgi:hypothetical protein
MTVCKVPLCKGNLREFDEGWYFKSPLTPPLRKGGSYLGSLKISPEFERVLGDAHLGLNLYEIGPD